MWVGSFESMCLVGPIDPGVRDKIFLGMASAEGRHSNQGKMRSILLQIVLQLSQGPRVEPNSKIIVVRVIAEDGAPVTR